MPRVAQHTFGTPAWFDLMTPDAPSARAFYGALFGWSFDLSGPEYGFYAMARRDDAEVAGLGQIPPGNPMPGAWTVYFLAEDADQTAAAITGNGGVVLMGPHEVGGAGRMIIAKDPTDAVFGVWQPGAHKGAGLIDEHGAMAWCEVNTPNLARATAFYGAVFGLRSEPIEGLGTPYSRLVQGEHRCAGVLQMNAAWVGVPPHWMVYFRVDDVAKAVGQVAALGGRVSHGPFETPYGRIAIVTDPQGAVFTLLQRPG